MSKYKIIVRHDCGFCRKAIAELLSRKQNIQVIDVTNDVPLREAHSLKNNNWPTVPMISLCDEQGNERFIGGYTDLMNELNAADKGKFTHKPWGYEIIWAQCDKYIGKQLYINGGHRLSLQKHLMKEETIMVQKGTLTLVVECSDGLEEKQLSVGDSYHITPGTIHRFWARNGPVLLVEVSTTELDDVVRIEDDFGRVE